MKDAYSSIFEYQVLHEASPETMAFGDIKMKKDFGTLKQGECYFSIWFYFEESKVDVFDSDNNITHTFEFEFKAK